MRYLGKNALSDDFFFSFNTNYNQIKMQWHNQSQANQVQLKKKLSY